MPDLIIPEAETVTVSEGVVLIPERWRVERDGIWIGDVNQHVINHLWGAMWFHRDGIEFLGSDVGDDYPTREEAVRAVLAGATR